jgi:predicted dehydrogenase
MGCRGVKTIGDLRLGVIGLSEGNGHPYSWAAIFNGYDAAAMAACPFPAIPEYLARQKFPDDAIPGARVTHVWAQDRAIAENVAAASLIPCVVDRYESMIGEVDAVLLARDDAENHFEMSVPFLDAGLPVYIDKPVALTISDLAALYKHQRHTGQIFSCSPLRFADEFQVNGRHLAELGDIKRVDAVTPNSWTKYGVHIVDPVLNMLDFYGRECEVRASHSNDLSVVTARWASSTATFTCLGAAPTDIRIKLIGSLSSRELVFRNTFGAFKRTLELFVKSVRTQSEVTTRTELASVVSILERGMSGSD